MNVIQKQIVLPKFTRGIHLITNNILESLEDISFISSGLLHIFIKHTSASIFINENSDPSVREDLESYINKIVPERELYYTHIFEGDDDMPAHIKTSLFGTNLIIPISDGKLNLGVWQGIYLGEHRNHASERQLVITILA